MVRQGMLAAYRGVGLGAALFVLWRRQGSVGERCFHALVAFGCWPFVLPVLLSPGGAGPRAEGSPRSERAQRLEEVAGRLEDCWRQAALEVSWAAEQGREHRLLDCFIARLRIQERRLSEMEVALAQAPSSVKERLARLQEGAARELEHSLGLVEELAAQLLLLRFAEVGNPSAARMERGHIEELLLRIEALAEASQPAMGEAPGFSTNASAS